MPRYLTALIMQFLFCLLLLFVRIIWSGSLTFIFLPWNYLLALTPVLFAHLSTRSRRFPWLYTGLWLLFFPNAAYLVTDLVHLHERPGIPFWYDLLLLSASAVSGLLSGFISLSRMTPVIRRLTGRKYNLMIFCALLLCGFGIYLGRFQRWNSWDLFTRPVSLAQDILNHALHPIRHMDAWLISLLFGTWMFLLYRQFKKHIPGRHE